MAASISAIVNLANIDTSSEDSDGENANDDDTDDYMDVELVDDEQDGGMVLPFDRVAADQVNGAENSNDVSNSANQDQQPSTSGVTSSGAANTDDDPEADSGCVCSICFEEYTNTGDTRVVCLPCGHLFCNRCAINTVKHSKSKKKSRRKGLCPNCRKPYELNDLRKIFGSKIKMIDTTQLEEAKREKDVALSMKRALQMELSTERQKNSDLLAKVRILEADLERLRKQNTRSFSTDFDGSKPYYDREIFSTGLSQIQSSQILFSVIFRKELEICKNSGSRVMDSSLFRNILLASYSSTTSNSHFSSYGVKKIDLNEFRCTSNLHLHSDELRDLRFNPADDGMVLSASKDKTLKLSSIFSNTVIHSYSHDRPVFSCCWKDGTPYYVFCGMANGKVFLYDTRASTGENVEPICEITNGVSPVPVTSLHWVERASEANASSSGLLVGRLNQCSFYELVSPSQFLLHPLPFRGNLTSLSYDCSTGYFLTSSRPRPPEQPFVQHQFCEFSYENTSEEPNSIVAKYSSRELQRFTSGYSQPLMTKNVLFAHPFSEKRCLAAVYNHSQSLVDVWESGSGQVVTSAKASKDVHQIVFLKTQNKPVLSVLDGQKLYFHEINS